MKQRKKGSARGLIFILAGLFVLVTAGLFYFAGKTEGMLPAPSEQRIEVTHVL